MDAVQRTPDPGTVIGALLMALAHVAGAQGFPPPPGLLLGVDAATAATADPGGGWPAAALLRRDPVTGEAWRIVANAPAESPLAAAAVHTQIYVVTGTVRLGGSELRAGDLLDVSAGAHLGRLRMEAGAALLLFRDPRGGGAHGRIKVTRGELVPWRSGTVARDAGAPAALEVKPLWTNSATGAQLHLVRVAPGVTVPWEVHLSAEEGYLLGGDYHLAECLPNGRRDFDYRAGAYFYRPAGLIHSGPESRTRAGAIWLIRTPAKLSAVFYPACPAPPAKENAP